MKLLSRNLIVGSLLVLSIPFTSFAAEKNGGVGHGNQLQFSPVEERGHVDFTEKNQDDFNGDHIPDRLICNHAKINNHHRINVRVINGKTNKDIFKWNWSEETAVRANGDKLLLTGCDVVYLRPNRPSIILSTAYSSNSIGVRVRAPQFIIHNRPSDNKLVARHIKIPGENVFFTSASRSVKCTQVPYALRKNGVKDGAFCFYAGYDSNLPFNRGYGTVTAFVKFEQGAGNDFIVKDLTSSSKLPWKGGMYGTKLKNIREVKLCNGAGKYDGLHMMGAAFVDFNRDGLKDFISVGQHASIRQHKMIYSSSYPEKFYFSTSYISDVHKGDMSEFLRIISLDENEQFANSSCVYISGEKENFCGSVPDHLRCYKNGKWETTFPEGSRFSSTMAPVSIKANGRGRYVVKSKVMGPSGPVGDRYYSLPGAFKNQIIMANPRVIKQSDRIIVRGWACVPNTRWRPRITISNKSHYSQAGYKRYYQRVTDINSEPMLTKRCMQTGTFPYRYSATILKKDLTQKNSGRIYVQADFYHTSKINTPHVQKSLAY